MEGFDKETLKTLYDKLSKHTGAKSEVAQRSANGNLGTVYKALHGLRPAKKVVLCALEVLAEREHQLSHDSELNLKIKAILSEFK